MRCSGWSSLAISACSALALATAAHAHVVATTPYVDAGATSELSLEVPNEREQAMTGLHVSVPADFRVVAASGPAGWQSEVERASVSWSGGRLEPASLTTFALTIEAPAAPGPASLSATQRYPGGATVRWPVAITVLPAEEQSQQLGRALVVGLVGLLVLGAIGILVWRRRGSALEER
jgi:hypothetical protein